MQLLRWFRNLDDLNAQLQVWLDTVANVRRLGLPSWCGGGRSEDHAAARVVIASMLARASTGVR